MFLLEPFDFDTFFIPVFNEKIINVSASRLLDKVRVQTLKSKSINQVNFTTLIFKLNYILFVCVLFL